MCADYITSRWTENVIGQSSRDVQARSPGELPRKHRIPCAGEGEFQILRRTEDQLRRRRFIAESCTGDHVVELFILDAIGADGDQAAAGLANTPYVSVFNGTATRSDSSTKACHEIRGDTSGTPTATNHRGPGFIDTHRFEQFTAPGADETGVAVELMYRDRIAMSDGNLYSSIQKRQGKVEGRYASTDDHDAVPGYDPVRIEIGVVHVVHPS